MTPEPKQDNMRTIADNKIFILSSPERTYPISYIDGLPQEHLELIVRNIENDRKIELEKKLKKK